MKKWLANNAVALGALASVFAILWVVWQAQHQITESILESETRLEARFEIRMAQLETQFEARMIQLEDRMTRLEARMTRLEDKMDDIQSNLDARLDLVEREQAELRGILEGMRR